jgi:hypothetical protein
VTHRDPVAITTSLATMVSYSARLSIDHPDPRKIGRYWSDRIEDLLNACVRDRDVLAPDRSMDLRFNDFMADEWGTVERIYQLADQPLTASSRQGMETFLSDHQRGRNGRVHYDPATFGIDRAERETALAGYRQRFGV